MAGKAHTYRMPFATHPAMPIVYNAHAMLESIALYWEEHWYCVALELDKLDSQLSSLRSWHSGIDPFCIALE